MHQRSSLGADLDFSVAYHVVEYPAARRWVTPQTARAQPVHRWYLFPHSFTGDLVHALVDEWGLSNHDRILDPFVGAGTTLVSARERNVSAFGYDISPLAVLIANTKTSRYSEERLATCWRSLLASQGLFDDRVSVDVADLVRRALPDGRLEAFQSLHNCIMELDGASPERDFFRLALLAILPQFSATAANGGWLRWRVAGLPAEQVVHAFAERVRMMLAEVEHYRRPVTGTWSAALADARDLPDAEATYSAVITSPPYPNRHDYTRVFGVELMFAFLSSEETRQLRHRSFHSHPEARPSRGNAPEYDSPRRLERDLHLFGDARIQRMLRGYFLDMYLCLREIRRVCRVGARIALVVGNVRYRGHPIMVDELTAEVGEQAGLSCREIRVARWRGNSAQQMGRFGRTASRESLVVFENDGA